MALREACEEGVEEGVTLPTVEVAVALGVAWGESVRGAGNCREKVGVAVPLPTPGLLHGVGVAEEEAVEEVVEEGEFETVGEALELFEPAALRLALGEAVGDFVGRVVALPLGEPEDVAVPSGDAEALALGVAVLELRAFVADAEAEGVIATESDSTALRVGVEEELAWLDGLPPFSLVALVLAEGDRVEVALEEGEEERVPEIVVLLLSRASMLGEALTDCALTEGVGPLLVSDASSDGDDEVDMLN